MKLLFVILAHNEPAHLVELARTLTNAASDAEAIIHFDASAAPADFDALSSQIREFPKLFLVESRVKCVWGGYSLVQAVLNAMQQVRDLGKSYDYVVLLSGACLPCRPIAQLERYLTENFGREFIETADESWMVGGYRKERYQQYFLLPASPTPSKLEHRFIALQKLVGVKRTPPDGLEIRFGSQWWGLTWTTCTKILDYLAQRPGVKGFFSRCYIPDEMVFPTLVWRLAEKRLITGFGLTHYQFTDRGKPVVFYEDHESYPFTLDRFFYRKVAREAPKLRAVSLRRACADDDGSDLSTIGQPNADYEVKAKSQTDFPVPGHIFYRDQYSDAVDRFTDTIKGIYIFVCGHPANVRTVLGSIKHPALQVMGRIFAPGAVDFGPGTERFSDLRRDDDRIRDLHPLYYMSRIVQRSSGVPVFGWAPGDLTLPMNVIMRDHDALIIAIPPIAKNSLKAETILKSALPTRRQPPMDVGVSPPGSTEFDGKGNTMPRQLFSALDGQYAPNVLTFPVDDRLQERSTQGDEKLLALGDASIFNYSLQNCLFRFHPWFPALLKALQGDDRAAIDIPLKAAQ